MSKRSIQKEIKKLKSQIRMLEKIRRSPANNAELVLCTEDIRKAQNEINNFELELKSL